MKVIFLDIDGVLNDLNTQRTFRGFQFVDEIKVCRLKRIVDATGAQIVLTSTWRLDYVDYSAIAMELWNHDMEIFDATPDLCAKVDRGIEIDTWLKEHPEVKEFVILDDWADMKPHMSHLVRTSLNRGLEDKHVRLAINKLNGR